jgi:Fe-S cluster biogenesis protein NfuA
MKEQVQSALNEIRPSLQADGGDVELVAWKTALSRFD